MDTEGQRSGQGIDRHHKRKAKMDQELSDIRARMENISFKMQQDVKVHWLYEWPMKNKVKWLVNKLLARGQRQLLRMWPRYVERLRGEEDMVHICEPETGKSLSDDGEKRSEKGLRNGQVSSEELSGFLEGNEKRSMVYLKDWQVSSEESSYFHVGNEMGSLEDLIDF